MDNNDKTKRLKDILGENAGMTVPDGFFESKFIEIQQELPPYPAPPVAERLSTWQRIRPYVYMAAMFAGIWLMMQVFHRVSGSQEHLSLDNVPVQVAQAVQSAGEEDMTLFMGPPEDDYELESEVAASFDDMSQFEEEFGYQLSPRYADMEVDSSNS